MPQKKITEVVVGDILSEDVRASNGRFLFKKGTILTQKHILVLKTWGVSRVFVEENPKEEKKIEKKQGNEKQDRFIKCFPPNSTKLSPMKDLYFIATKLVPKHLKTINLPLDILKKTDTGKKVILPPRLKISPEKLVDSQKELCSLPSIYQKMMDVLNDPNASAANIGEVVSKDPSLTAKLLRIANSPHLGLISKVQTVSRAISILGIDHLKLLAKGVIIIEGFKKIPVEIMDMKQFWKHSIAVGLMASLLSSHRVGMVTEKFFVAGLLHDIGKLVMLVAMPGIYLNIMLCAKDEKVCLHEAEKRILGFDHGDIGAILSEKWYFPSSFTEMIKTHHDPEKSDMPEETSVLYISDILAQVSFYGFGGNIFIPYLSKDVVEISGIDPSCYDIVATTFFKQIKMLEKIFL